MTRIDNNIFLHFESGIKRKRHSKDFFFLGGGGVGY